MIYNFFKKHIPTESSGQITLSEKSEYLKLAFLKLGEKHWVKETHNQIEIIPSGAFNPIGMIPLKNFEKLRFDLTPEISGDTKVEYWGRRKWSSATVKLYTGMTYLILLLYLCCLLFFILDYDGALGIFLIFSVLFTVIFGLSFLFDLYILFSKQALRKNIERKILLRVAKIAQLINQTDPEETRKSFKVRGREAFVQIARSKATTLLWLVWIQNISLVLGVIGWFCAVDDIGSDNTSALIIFIISILMIFFSWIAALCYFIFFRTSNILLIMEAESIGGKGALNKASWFSLIPFGSILSLFSIRSFKEEVK